MSAIIRKIVTVVEETQMEMGRQVSPPTRRAAAIAVIENPFAGKYVEDLSPLIAIGEELGELLSKRAVAALDVRHVLGQRMGMHGDLRMIVGAEQVSSFEADGAVAERGALRAGCDDADV